MCVMLVIFIFSVLRLRKREADSSDVEIVRIYFLCSFIPVINLILAVISSIFAIIGVIKFLYQYPKRGVLRLCEKIDKILTKMIMKK